MERSTTLSRSNSECMQQNAIPLEHSFIIYHFCTSYLSHPQTRELNLTHVQNFWYIHWWMSCRQTQRTIRTHYSEYTFVFLCDYYDCYERYRNRAHASTHTHTFHERKMFAKAFHVFHHWRCAGDSPIMNFPFVLFSFCFAFPIIVYAVRGLLCSVDEKKGVRLEHHI